MASREDARDALYEAIMQLAQQSNNYSGDVQARMVHAASLAYRAVIGGAQPGGGIIENG